MKMRLFEEKDVKRYTMRNGSLGFRLGNYQVSQHDLDRVQEFLDGNPRRYTSDQIRAELHLPNIGIVHAALKILQTWGLVGYELVSLECQTVPAIVYHYITDDEVEYEASTKTEASKYETGNRTPAEKPNVPDTQKPMEVDSVPTDPYAIYEACTELLNRVTGEEAGFAADILGMLGDRIAMRCPKCGGRIESSGSATYCGTCGIFLDAGDKIKSLALLKKAVME